jgi:hypothetical protein
MKKRNTHDEVALLLAKGAVALVLIIAIGAFGRSLLLAILTHKNYPISENATQLITALGSALVGGAVGFIGGSSPTKQEKEEADEQGITGSN